MYTFKRIFEEAAARAMLRDMVNQLEPNEVKIVSVYIGNVLKTRPIKGKQHE